MTHGILSGAGLGDAFDEMNKRLQSFMHPDAQPGKPAPDSTIDWWCWDHPNFKECHTLAFATAQVQCNLPGIQGTPAYNTCVVTGADELAKKSCGCPATNPSNKLSPDAKKKLVAFALFAVALGVWLHEPNKKAHTANRHRRNGNPDDPPPKFKLGERVRSKLNRSITGTVSFIAGYDPFISGYRYKIQQDDGARLHWNEGNMQRIRRRSR